MPILAPTLTHVDTHTILRLVDGAREMALAPRPEIELQVLDVGWPEILEVTETRTDDDGEDDTTSRFGARAVSVEMVFLSTPLSLLDELRGFCHPSARPYLHIRESEWGGERRIRLRADNQRATRSVSMPAQNGILPVLAQWRAPDGVLEAVDEQRSLLPAVGEGQVGADVPWATPLVMPATTGNGATLVTVGGTVPVHWTARLYGPCTGPRITLDEYGHTLAFPDLVIPAGDFLELRTKDRTAYYNGDRGASRLRFLDFTTAAWWRLRPETSQVRYHPDEPNTGCMAEIIWRSAWL